MKASSSLYHAMSAEGALRELGSNANIGLSHKEARSRYRKFGKNRIYEEPHTSLLGYIGYIVSDLMLILLLITVATAAVFGEKTEAGAIIPILIFSIVVRTYAYIKSRRYIESSAISTEAMPNVHVLRDGELYRLDMRRVVIGDIVSLRAGDIVPADCRIITSDNLYVYEEGITGLHGPVIKNPDETDPSAPPAGRTDVLFAGSCVILGECRAVVFATAEDTYASITYGQLKMTRSGDTKLSGLLDRYSRIWGAAMTAVAFLLSVFNFIFAERGVYEVFIMGVALAVAAMCEYYSAMGDIAVAAGLSALAGKGEDSSNGAKVRCVNSIEALAALDAIVFSADGVISTDETECHFVAVGKSKLIEGESNSEYEKLFECAAASTGVYCGDLDGGENKRSPHTQAIYKYLKETDFPASERVPLCGVGVLFGTSNGELPFDTTLLRHEDGFRAYMNGEGADIIKASAYYMTDAGEKLPMTEGVMRGLLNVVSYHERRGAHVVAVAIKDTPFHSRERLNFAVSDVTFVGLLAFYKALIPDIEFAVSECRRAGIRLIMTGHDRQDALTARHAGIIDGREDIITGREYAALTTEQKKRVTETKKLLLGFGSAEFAEFMDLMRKTGHRAAYVGDNSRDIMTELRILHGVGASFAVSDGLHRTGKNGKGELVKSRSYAGTSEAMKLQADGIIPKADRHGGGLTSVLESSAYARVIYRNISSIFDYLITSETARMFAVLYAVIFHASSLGAVQILIWGLIFDFFSVIIISLEYPDDDILLCRPDTFKKLSHPFSGILTPLLYGILWATATLFVTGAAALTSDEIASVIFISVSLSVTVVLGENREHLSLFSRKRHINPAEITLIIFIAGIIVFSVIFPTFASLIGIMQPTVKVLLLSLISPVLLFAAYELSLLREQHSKSR